MEKSQKPNKVYWTCKDGTKIDVDEMSIEHLRNCLKMVIRKLEKIEAIQNDECTATEFDLY